jgi:hypothetical protein
MTSEDELDLRDPGPDLEEEYEYQQNAHFAFRCRAERGFMGTTVENVEWPSHRVTICTAMY